MNSHLLNYRFSPDQNDIQYSPPCSMSTEPCWWTCKRPDSSWLLPLQETTLAAGPHTGVTAWTLLPPLLLLIAPHPCSMESVSIETGSAERMREDGRRWWRRGHPFKSRILSAPSCCGADFALTLHSGVVYRSLAEPGQGTWRCIMVCNEYSALFKNAALSPCLSWCCFKWS